MFEECLYFNSNALARSVTKIWTEAYREFDLSPPHAFLLRVVLAKPGLLPRELADELKLSRSTISRFLDALEKQGLLTRKATNEDGRELQVYPTKQANKIHKDLDSTGKKLTMRMKKIVGKEELTETIDQLRQIQQLISND